MKKNWLKVAPIAAAGQRCYAAEETVCWYITGWPKFFFCKQQSPAK
jgi:hypothetical protein